MEVTRFLALRGPNIWANFPVMEAWVDLGEWNDLSSDMIPGFTERLMKWLPGLIEHRCSVGERGGFLQRLQRGTYLAHILEHVTLELQGLAGVQVGFGKARATAEDRVYKVVFRYREENLARACLHAGKALCEAAVRDEPFDIEGTVARLRDVAKKHLLSPGAEAIVQSARKRNIPFIRLGDGDLVQFGYGSKQRRTRGTETDRAGAIAGAIPYNKDLTAELLAAAGVPVLAEDDEKPEGNDYALLVVAGRVAAAVERPARDVTAMVHAEVAERAVEAAQAVGLDIAGISLVAKDIGVPLEKQGGLVTEVTPSPDLQPFLDAGEAEGRAAADAIVNQLFELDDNGRIPIAAVTGTNGKTTVTRLLAHLMRGMDKCVGMTCTDGIYVNEKRISKGDCSGPASARSILMNPNVEVAVFETARGGIVRAGLAFDECQAAVVTNIGEGDHLGIHDVNTREDLAKAKRTIVDVVGSEGTAVLNAADPLVAAMAEYCHGSVLYFGMDGAHPVIQEHRARGGAAIFARGHSVVLALGESEVAELDLREVPITFGGRVPFEVENVLAAVGAAWAMGLDWETIVRQVRSFVPDLTRVPTRFNVFDVRGATVIVDFGHNVDALRAVIESLRAFPNARRAALFSSAGDRRNEDIERMGELLGEAFDRVILYEDTDLYGRQPGAILELLRRGVARGSRVKQVEEVKGGLNAMKHALETVEAGELLLAQAHMADPTVEYLRGYLGGA